MWHWIALLCSADVPCIKLITLSRGVRHLHTERRAGIGIKQEAQLSPRDRAMHPVSWNLANCHATVQKLLVRQVLNKSMLWSSRFSWRQCCHEGGISVVTVRVLRAKKSFPRLNCTNYRCVCEETTIGEGQSNSFIVNYCATTNKIINIQGKQNGTRALFTGR